MIELYIGRQFKKNHEVEQFNQILDIINLNEKKLGDFCVIFGGSYISGEEVDCLIFKNDAIIALEMKSCNAKIQGGENGEFWKINNQPFFKNIFQQCYDKRFAIFDALNKFFYPKFQKLDVQSWAVFSYGADCSQIDISEKNSRWFRAISLDVLAEQLISKKSSLAINSLKTIMEFASDLMLDRKKLSDWIAYLPEIQLEETRHLRPMILEDYEEYRLDKNTVQEYVIRYPKPEQKEPIVIAFIKNKKTGKSYLSTAIRIPFFLWEDIEDYILKVEQSWDDLKTKNIKMKEKDFCIRIGPKEFHNHKGLLVEILKNGKSLKKPNYLWFNMRGIQKFQEIILERRN
jgi:hypothetical protein